MRPAIRIFISVSFLFGCAVTCGAQQKSVSFLRLGANIVQRKVNLNPTTPDQRRTILRKLFKDAGCTDIVEQPVSGSGPSISCSTSGTSDSSILVAASIDYSAKGDAAVLRWGDLAMLTTLAESLGSVLTRHRLVFIGFAGSNGEAGAKAYLEALTPEQRKKISAIVALDGIGRSMPVFSIPNSGQGLDIRTGRLDRGDIVDWFNPNMMTITRSIPAAAQRWGFEVPRKTGEFGADIVKPFHREPINAITFTSPSWVALRYVGDHAIRDYRSKLDPTSYNNTYLFLCTYLLHLDRDFGASLPPPELVANAQIRLEDLKPVEKFREKELATTFPLPQIAAPQPPASATPAMAASAGSKEPLDTTAPVFRATTRLVQVDVVATDNHGAPLQGLRKEDFTILQDGRPQTARVFESHTAAQSAVAQTAAPAQENPAQPHYLNSYSNAPDPSATQTWTIILFDMLNTPAEDQQVARNQLKKLAEQVPNGQPVALFTLTSRLVMVQPFTRDTRQLMASVKRLDLWTSQVLSTEAQRQQEVGSATYAATALTDVSIPAEANVDPQNVGNFQRDTANRLLQSTRDLESLRLDQRVFFTLDAFAGISRALAGYPGRKNVVWLSGNFPIQVLPNNQMDDKWRYATDYLEHLSRTTALLSQARVAVYPVDIRGMQVQGIDIANSTEQNKAFVGYNVSSYPLTAPDKTSPLQADQAFTRADERATMMEVAEQTGGRAFVNTNDFNRAIRNAIEDGSNYYTLAYTPDKKDDKPAYHRIEVKLNRPGVKLNYRRGYYSEPELGTPQAGSAALQAAIQPGMPPSTMVLFTAIVKPPDATHKTVQLDYVINPSNVTFADAPGGKHIIVDCLAVALDKEGKEVAHASDTLDGTLPVSTAEAQVRRGIPASQELQLKPGVYNLRIGVMDRASQSIGTVSASVEVK